MALIYVTGISGAGKSAVCDELRRRGHVAFDTDRDGFKSWFDRTTGDRIADTRRWSDASVEWRRRYGLDIDREKVEPLATRAAREPGPVFLCGTSAGEETVWHLFSKVIHLSVSEETLVRRIQTRANDFGKDPDDLADILAWHQSTDERMASFGAVTVDGEQPLDSVVDDVVRIALTRE